jgi:2-methylisocitrate lyase-like PEP mutase family enzyme
MDIATQRQKAEAFRKLHDRSKILVLPNAWDAASARIFETAGFPAIATTSSGVANSLGYPDGEVVPRVEMIAAIARVARVLTVPLSADIESGYAADTENLKATISATIEAGAVGINFEDGMHDGSRQLFPLETAVARIKSVREIADAAGVPLVINARTDVYLHAIGEKSSRFEQTVTRANAYLAAGADCAFVPGIADADTIGKVAAAIQGPINVMAVPGTPSTLELHQLGVARVSMGGGPARAALTAAHRVAEELMRDGSYTGFTARDIISHMEMNQLFAKKP